MEKLNARETLKASILELEHRRDVEAQMLKDQVHSTFDTLRPINLIKSTLKDITISNDLKGNVLNTSLGLTVGYVAKVLFQGFSRNPIRRILGSAVMFGVTNLVSKNPKTTQKVGVMLFRLIRGKNNAPKVNGVYHDESRQLLSGNS